MKHRQPPSNVTPVRTTVAEMIGWQPPAGVRKKSGRLRDDVIDPREDQAFELEGDAWRGKLSEDDCDIHLEISARGAGRRADRVIIEIPQGEAFLPTRETLLKLLDPATVVGDGRLDPHKPIPVRVTGYAFYDAVHFRNNLPRGKSHGSKYVATLWEIHPVWKIEVLAR